MDYEKAYKDALERAREWHNDQHITIGLKGNLEEIFPELKESEDEKIRKWIKEELESKYVVDNIVNNEIADKALAWLEKQGEQHEKEKQQWIDKACKEHCNCCGYAYMACRRFNYDNLHCRHYVKFKKAMEE